MRERDEPASKYAWIVYAVAMLIVGAMAGYIIALQAGSRPPTAASASATVAAAASPSVVDEAQLRAYREILARDPKNFAAAVGAGDLLYDAQRYHEAIGFYQQAFAENSSDVNVSTDLGTALWYAGRPDDALAQYDKSLRIDATHAQTLFNIGIVRADGKQDYQGAIEVWERLLRSNPTYPDAARVRSLIASAAQKRREPRS
jgi:tetratricopeptide (TPR) repeat protein